MDAVVISGQRDPRLGCWTELCRSGFVFFTRPEQPTFPRSHRASEQVAVGHEARRDGPPLEPGGIVRVLHVLLVHKQVSSLISLPALLSSTQNSATFYTDLVS